MAEKNIIYVGDTPEIQADTEQIVAGYSVLQIKAKPPVGDVIVWDADSVLDGTKAVYQVLDDEIDMSGDWKFQTYLELGSYKGHGETHIERIYDVWETP